MKISISKLQKIIKEEIENVLKEEEKTPDEQAIELGQGYADEVVGIHKSDAKQKLHNLKTVETEKWDDGTEVIFKKIPIPLVSRKPFVPSKMIDDAEIGSVDVNSLVSTQGKVTQSGVEKYLEPQKDSSNPLNYPLVYRTKDGTAFIQDGHHRAVAALLRGDKQLKARIVDVQDDNDTEKLPEAPKTKSISKLEEIIKKALKEEIENVLREEEQEGPDPEKEKSILADAIKSGALGKYAAEAWSREPTEKNPEVTPTKVISYKIKDNLQGSGHPYIDLIAKAEEEDEETGKLYFKNFDAFAWLVLPGDYGYDGKSTQEIKGQEKYKLYGEW